MSIFTLEVLVNEIEFESSTVIDEPLVGISFCASPMTVVEAAQPCLNETLLMVDAGAAITFELNTDEMKKVPKPSLPLAVRIFDQRKDSSKLLRSLTSFTIELNENICSILENLDINPPYTPINPTFQSATFRGRASVIIRVIPVYSAEESFYAFNYYASTDYKGKKSNSGNNGHNVNNGIKNPSPIRTILKNPVSPTPSSRNPSPPRQSSPLRNISPNRGGGQSPSRTRSTTILAQPMMRPLSPSNLYHTRRKSPEHMSPCPRAKVIKMPAASHLKINRPGNLCKKPPPPVSTNPPFKPIARISNTSPPQLPSASSFVHVYNNPRLRSQSRSPAKSVVRRTSPSSGTVRLNALDSTAITNGNEDFIRELATAAASRVHRESMDMETRIVQHEQKRHEEAHAQRALQREMQAEERKARLNAIPKLFRPPIPITDSISESSSIRSLTLHPEVSKQPKEKETSHSSGLPHRVPTSKSLEPSAIATSMPSTSRLATSSRLVPPQPSRGTSASSKGDTIDKSRFSGQKILSESILEAEDILFNARKFISFNDEDVDEDSEIPPLDSSKFMSRLSKEEEEIFVAPPSRMHPQPSPVSNSASSSLPERFIRSFDTSSTSFLESKSSASNSKNSTTPQQINLQIQMPHMTVNSNLNSNIRGPPIVAMATEKSPAISNTSFEDDFEQDEPSSPLAKYRKRSSSSSSNESSSMMTAVSAPESDADHKKIIAEIHRKIALISSNNMEKDKESSSSPPARRKVVNSSPSSLSDDSASFMTSPSLKAYQPVRYTNINRKNISDSDTESENTVELLESSRPSYNKTQSRHSNSSSAHYNSRRKTSIITRPQSPPSPQPIQAPSRSPANTDQILADLKRRHPDLVSTPASSIDRDHQLLRHVSDSSNSLHDRLSSSPPLSSEESLAPPSRRRNSSSSHNRNMYFFGGDGAASSKNVARRHSVSSSSSSPTPEQRRGSATSSRIGMNFYNLTHQNKFKTSPKSSESSLSSSYSQYLPDRRRASSHLNTNGGNMDYGFLGRALNAEESVYEEKTSGTNQKWRMSSGDPTNLNKSSRRGVLGGGSMVLRSGGFRAGDSISSLSSFD